MHDKNIVVEPIPTLAGIGLRAEHYQEIINTKPDIAWFEVHTENYFGNGGKPHYYLELIRQNYPLSFHGVGLSLGSCDELDLQHLNRLKELITRYEPILVSEHLCWTSINGNHFNDLFPMPYTEESLKHIINRINRIQDNLNRQILIENISTYLQFTHSTIPEYEFINIIAQKTGCGILLDINNLYVNSINHGWNIKKYIENIAFTSIQEIHLAGFTENFVENSSILIDSHNNPIADEVFEIYSFAMKNFGKKPTLIEWDKDIPLLEILLIEATKVNNILQKE